MAKEKVKEERYGVWGSLSRTLRRTQGRIGLYIPNIWVFLAPIRHLALSRAPNSSEAREVQRAAQKISKDIPVIITNKWVPYTRSYYLEPGEASRIIQSSKRNSPRGLINRFLWGTQEINLDKSTRQREAQKGSIIMSRNLARIFPLARAYEEGKLHQKLGPELYLPEITTGAGAITFMRGLLTRRKRLIKAGQLLSAIGVLGWFGRHVYLNRKAKKTSYKLSPKLARQEKLIRALDLMGFPTGSM